MKKIIFTVLVLTGLGFNVSAQVATQNQPKSATFDKATSDRVSFKTKSFALETALKANNFAEAQKLMPEVQQMIMKRGDDFLGKDEAKVKQFHQLGYEMKALIANVEANKDKIIKLIPQVQSIY